MTHLCYIYIYTYRLLKNVEITFDHHYTFKMGDGKLHIDKRNALPEQFFGNGIHSVTSIVGNNGAGKTSALRFVMESVVEGYRIQEMDGIIVYENGGKLTIYQPNNDARPKMRIVSSVPFTQTSNLQSIPVMYYSGHFSPVSDRNDIMNSELQGSYIASDQWLLVHDLLNYSNFDSIYLVGRMYSYMWAYAAQNNARICELLLMEGVQDLLKDLRLPKYILIGHNDGGAERLANDTTRKVKIPGFESISKDIKQNNIARFIYTNIVNLIAEKETEQDDYVNILTQWQQTPKNGEVLDAFKAFIHHLTESDSICKGLLSICNVLKMLVSICSYDENAGIFYVEVETGKQQLRELIDDLFSSHFYVTAKFFDIYYSHGLYPNTVLSSGEQEMLNLLSRLYHAITLQPKRVGNRQSPTLLLLDEAEIGFHPEWQRKYVNLLLQFLSRKMMVKPKVDFQLVITSHSPIILSDMPLCCVNILQRKEDGETEVRTGEPQTFGENVFNLYRRAFVMKDGLVGEFASRKIRALYERIEKGENSEEIVKEVMMIGDERVKNYLLSEMSRRDKDFIASYYQRKLNNTVGDE